MALQKLIPLPSPQGFGINVEPRAELTVWQRREEQANEIKTQLGLTCSLGSATCLLCDLGKPLPLSGPSFQRLLELV